MTTAIRHRLICAVSAVALAIPCLAAHQAPEPQQPAAVSPLQPPAAQAPETPVYILQAGDELEIKAFNLPELDHKVRIRPDGKISLLLLDDVQAEGMPAGDLSKYLSSRYAEHFRNPRVTVVVASFSNRNIYVGGEVNMPQMIPLNGTLTAAGAIFRSGGLKTTAKTKEIVILRNSGNNTPIMTKLNLNDVFTKGAADVTLQPFDVVFVPKSTIAKIDQFVDQYMKQLQPISITLGFNYLLGGQSIVIP